MSSNFLILQTEILDKMISLEYLKVLHSSLLTLLTAQDFLHSLRVKCLQEMLLVHCPDVSPEQGFPCPGYPRLTATEFSRLVGAT